MSGLDEEQQAALRKFKQDVASANPIKIGAVKLNNAGLVVGGLVTDKDAGNLILNRIAPGPRSGEESARQRAQDGQEDRCTEMVVIDRVAPKHQHCDVYDREDA